MSKDLNRAFLRTVLPALALGLAGCPMILESEHRDRVDADGDGYYVLGYDEGNDCDDTNAAVHVGATEICADGLDNDCNGDANTCGLSGTLSISDADHLIVPTDRASKLGYSVANAGDVNGDGREDLLVGAPGVDATFPQTGAAYLFLGPPGTARKSDVGDADLKVVGYTEDEQVGYLVAGGGDMDGDGYGDILLGAPYLSGGGVTRAGAWYVVLGPGGPAMATSAAWGDAEGEADYDALGTSVASGDLDGVGQRDLVAGAPNANEDGGDAGHVFLHAGPVQGAQQPNRAASDLFGKPGDLAGTALAAGDLDGDGTDDLLVGAPGSDGDGNGAGTAYLMLGPVAGSGLLSNNSDGFVTGLAAGDGAGASLAIGDMNGDGYLDAVVGAPTAEGVSATAGSALVVLGPFSGSRSADGGAMGQTTDDEAGASIAVADADGDGVDDILVGAPSRDVSATDTGAIYLLYGPVDTFIALGKANVKIAGAAEDDFAGHSGALVDWDGTGTSDLFVGVWGQDQNGELNNGGLVYNFTVQGL